MNNNSRKTVRASNQPEYTARYYAVKFVQIFRRGILSLKGSKSRLILVTVVVIAMAAMLVYKEELFASVLSDKLQNLFCAATLLMVSIGTVLLLGVLVPGADTENMFFRIGLVNSLQEPPLLCHYIRSKQTGYETFIFSVNGIPLEQWHEKEAAIETVLKRDIVSISNHKNKFHVKIIAVPRGTKLPDNLTWDDDLTPSEDFELLLGESMVGPVKLNLNRMPHMLIGGATGSGKTILVKTLLRQCFLKGAIVILADFKGGLDYSGFKENVSIVTERPAFAESLQRVLAIMNERKGMLAAADSPNIVEYNKSAEQQLKHIIVSCDELAEVTDKSGEAKAGKAEIDSIIGNMSTIARMGRAYGIHLILGVQRGDANVVPGQVRNNLGYRVCGYAPDKVLADICLDNAEAVEKLRVNVTGDVPGRFVDDKGNLFQGYYL